MPPHNDIDDLVGLTVLCSSAKRHINEPECLEPQNVASPGSLLSDVGIPRVASSFYCPLTMALMKDPVQDREGNSYEREAIIRWLETNSTSPITRNALKMKHLTLNRALRDAIEFEAQKQQNLINKECVSRAESSSQVLLSKKTVLGAITVKHHLVINKCLSDMNINACLDCWGIAFLPMDKLKPKLNAFMVIEAPPSVDTFNICTHFDSISNHLMPESRFDNNRVLNDLMQSGKHGALTLSKMSNNRMRFCFEGNVREITTARKFKAILLTFSEVAYRMKKKMATISAPREQPLQPY